MMVRGRCSSGSSHSGWCGEAAVASRGEVLVGGSSCTTSSGSNNTTTNTTHISLLCLQYTMPVKNAFPCVKLHNSKLSLLKRNREEKKEKT